MKMTNPSQSLVPNLSLLTALTIRPVFRDAVEFATVRYAETLAQHSSNILTYQCGDGMGCHGWFNRGFAEKFARSARKAGNRIQFVVKRKKDIRYIGDVVLVDKFKGQTRFTAELENKKYQLLHMTAKVDEENKTLEVYNIGPARKEYLKNQSSRVLKTVGPNLFDQQPNELTMVVDDDNATRIIIVTRVSKYKDKVETWACIPTSDFDEEACIIQLSEMEKICEKPIITRRPTVEVTPKRPPYKGNDHGIVITPRNVA